MIHSWQVNTDKPVVEIMKMVYEQSGLKAMLAAEKSEDPAANVQELINSAVDYDSRIEKPALDDYLQQIALVSDADAYDEQAGAVSLMTLHTAKGLEFPVVLIVGVEEGLIPHARSAENEKEIEEERRLLFVGITRAQKKLCLSYASNRTFRGTRQATIRSTFLRGLEGLVFRREIEYEPDHNLNVADDLETGLTGNEPLSFIRGQLVRHSKFGLGRIQEAIASRDHPRVVVRFNAGGQKTIELKYAKLEKLDE